MHPMVPAAHVVTKRRRDTADTFTLELAPAQGGTTCEPFQPGQFNMLMVHGVGEVPISVSARAQDAGSVTHTTRNVGTVTRALAALRTGDALGVRGPFGRGWPVDESEGRDIVVVAGGIGLAPLRPAIEHVASRRDRYGRVALLYGARTPADLLYRADLDRWSLRRDIQVLVTVDRAAGAWHGRVGVVPPLVKQLAFDREHTSAWICGPEVMMRYAAMELVGRGVPDDRVSVSLERNMKCGIGHCGHCQLGPTLLCRDGPVLGWDRAAPLVALSEL